MFNVGSISQIQSQVQVMAFQFQKMLIAGVVLLFCLVIFRLLLQGVSSIYLGRFSGLFTSVVSFSLVALILMSPEARHMAIEYGYAIACVCGVSAGGITNIPALAGFEQSLSGALNAFDVFKF